MSREPARPAAQRLTVGLIALCLVAAFSFGAIVRVALADHYHVNCVGHGLVHGDSTTDGSFFSRVEPGCGSTYRYCQLATWGQSDGYQAVSGTTATCNFWSLAAGDFTECASTAHVSDPVIWGEHVHKAHNWCGG